MTRDELIKTANRMQDHGGTFVRKLGELIPLADSINLQAIQAGWPEYLYTYGPGCMFDHDEPTPEEQAEKAACEAEDTMDFLKHEQP